MLATIPLSTTEIPEYFATILEAAKQVWDTLEKDGIKHTWRWDLEDGDTEPKREKTPQKPDKIVESDGKWILKNQGKTDKEVLLRHDVPRRICQEWVDARKEGWSKRQFEEQFLKCRGVGGLPLTGIGREYLRPVLTAIARAGDEFEREASQSSGQDQQQPSPIPLPAKSPISRLPLVEWAKDLRAKTVWFSQERPLPALDDEVLERVNEFVSIVRDAENIVILEGAGVSVAAGIPDFRSDKGLFKKYGKFIFQAATFISQEDAAKHHRAMGEIATIARKASHSPTPWSILKAFLAEVKYCRPLQRIFTLNIDGLDLSFKYLNTGRDGQAFPPAISNPLVCYLHGNLRFTRCPKCGDYETLLPERHLDLIDLECAKCVLDSKGYRPTYAQSIRPWVVLYNSGTERDDPNSVEKAHLIQWDRGDNVLLPPEELDSSPEQEYQPKRRKTQVNKSTRSKPPKAKKPPPPPITIPPPNGFNPPEVLVVVGTSARIDEIINIIRGHAGGILERGGKVVWVNREPPPIEIEGYFTHIFAGPQVGDCQILAQYFLAGASWDTLTV